MNLKTIAVTGAAGFIGSQMVRMLEECGHSVISIDHPEYFIQRKELNSIRFQNKVSRSQFITNMQNGSLGSVEAVIHLGACSNTTEMNEAYLKEVNVEYTQKLWNLCTQNKIPFIYASSAATYGSGELGYADEESTFSQLKPLNPYGYSKKIIDDWILKEESENRLPPFWSGFKFFNVYGFGEAHKKEMSSVVFKGYQQIKKNKKHILFKSHKPGVADGFQKRDFIFVEDVCHALYFALTKPIKRGIFNLGTGQARSFIDLSKAIFKSLNIEENIEFIEMPLAIRNQYQYFTEAEMSKLQKESFGRPFTTLEEGVHKYIQALEKFYA